MRTTRSAGAPLRLRSPVRLLAVATLLVLAACGPDATAPAPPPPDSTGAAPQRPVGLVEVTLSGIGTAQATATAGAPAAFVLGGPRFDLLPPGGGGGGNGSIQLQPVSTGSFTSGTPGAGGVRYVWATFRVRNAQTDGTAYATARTNLTFFAAATSSTLSGSAIESMKRFDGSAAAGSIALGIVPTGNVQQMNGTVVSSQADVLQVLAEGELATIPAVSGVTLLPYGFVVRNAVTGGRTLAASPAAGQYDGVVTFAFRFPLQATAVEDPFTVTALFQALDDGTTRLTQSLEEQTWAGEGAVNARAAAIGATQVTLLPGGRYGGVAPLRLLCAVRTAGTAASPTAYLVNPPPASVVGLVPYPFAVDGGGSRIPTSGALTALGCSGLSPTPASFTVNGSQTGRHFLGQGYVGQGTTTAATPRGSFQPGEEVEVTLTTGLGISAAYVARYRVASGAATGTFGTAASHGVGRIPFAVAIGDLNGDGKLDLAVTNAFSNNVSVLLGTGDGGFGAAVAYGLGVGNLPNSVAIGDLNGDGKLDLVVPSANYSMVSVLPGNGDGTFGPAADHPGGGAYSVAIGDLNGDGKLDLAVGAWGPTTVLLGDGNGGLGEAGTYGAADATYSVAIGDLNGDGKLDLAMTNFASKSVSVLLGSGDGSFHATPDHVVGEGPRSVAIGDLNGDGKLDLATANSASDDVSVLLGDGAGSFGAAVSYHLGSTPYSVAIGDLNGDGKLDLAVAKFYSNTVSVLLGNGGGSFGAATDYGVDKNPCSVAIGDLNGDGKLDLVTANMNGNAVSVLLGR